MGRPLVLFGAFDRHNLGDMLLAHVAAALLPGQDLAFAGLAARDLRAVGGHEVQPLPQVLAGPGGRAAGLLHVGGETLTCSAWQAAVMLQPGGDVTPLVRHLETRGAARQAWVRACVGRRSAAPYVVAKGDFAALQRVVFSGVGGVGLPLCEPALRAEVLAALAAADAVGVRDRCTLRHLQAAGIAAALSPDPAALVAELFGARIAAAGGQGDAAAADARFRSSGYLAAQCSAEFGDDTTLGMLAAQLDGFAAAAGLGLVFFRAGTAPWHDDLELYRRLALRVRVPSQVATSTDLWQLVALIAQSRGFCGSSLHGSIVAAAFGLPRLALRAPAGPRPAKVEAYTDAWELPGLPGSAAIADLGRGLRRAFAADRTALAAHAARLALQARAGFAALQAVLLG